MVGHLCHPVVTVGGTRRISGSVTAQYNGREGEGRVGRGREDTTPSAQDTSLDALEDVLL